MSEYIPAEIPDGKYEINGHIYMGDGKGGFQPVETIKPQHLIEDETVRKILGYGIALSEQLARFKEHTFDDISSHEAILEQEYGSKLGGPKGNKTLQSVDGLFKVEVRISDYIAFGPELQVAKGLFDECLNEWASDARSELRAFVTGAFQTDKTGNTNRSRIFMLLRQDIADPRWREGQRAIREAMRVVGSKTHIRCYRRDSHDSGWEHIALGMAGV